MTAYASVLWRYAAMLALTVSVAASAQTRPGTPLPAGTSSMVWAGDTLYVSGSLDPDLKVHTDTTSQTVGLLKSLQALLEAQKLTLGDVVMMHVYLGGELGKPDFDGMMAGYTQFFGTKEQPNKPARTTLQVVLPAGARGALIEIDLVAVRGHGRTAEAAAGGRKADAAPADAPVDFLLASAAKDFRTHPPRPAAFRDVRIGYVAGADGAKSYRMCGAFQAAGGTAEWIPFATVKTSGYEQYIGGNGATFCDPASIVWIEGDFSSRLKARLDARE